MPTRYWVGVVSRNHVQRGVAGGFAQVCHGKCAPLRRMSPGDVLIYYSPKTERDGGVPLKSFTAIGIVQADEPYQVEMTPAFHPFRINVAYDTQVEAAPIHPMLSKLSFTKQELPVHTLSIRESVATSSFHER
ncbi:hypothetical protein DYB32_010257 [Aphanomyces invadans]|uniref:EVE domain-containing protein n=1 Tax=Aphanomyces invadans TaxID=157072 RepID=A0A3R6ZHC7_9STRA|nr:hypothetical protein DYB32_010257 [Aphanomyces invadans]